MIYGLVIEAITTLEEALLIEPKKHAAFVASAPLLHAETPVFERLENKIEITNFPITSAASKSSGDVVNYRNMKEHTAYHLAIPGNVTLEFVYMLSFVSMIGLIQWDVQLSFSDHHKCGRVSLEVQRKCLQPKSLTLAQATLSNVRSFVSMIGLIQGDVQLSFSDHHKCGCVSLEVQRKCLQPKSLALVFERLENKIEITNFPITSAASKSSGDVVNYRNMKEHTAYHLAIPGNVTLEFVYMLSFVSMIGLIQWDVQLSFSDHHKCGRVSLEVQRKCLQPKSLTLDGFLALPHLGKHSSSPNDWSYLGYDPLEGKHKVLCVPSEEYTDQSRVLTLGIQESWRHITKGRCPPSPNWNTVALVTHDHPFDVVKLYILEDAHGHEWKRFVLRVPCKSVRRDSIYFSGTTDAGEFIFAPYGFYQASYILFFDPRRNSTTKVFFERIWMTLDAAVDLLATTRSPCMFSQITSRVSFLC
ncbi:hypothetical protein F2Q68_00005734, partial [Brassica cretica]